MYENGLVKRRSVERSIGRVVGPSLGLVPLQTGVRFPLGRLSGPLQGRHIVGMRASPKSGQDHITTLRSIA